MRVLTVSGDMSRRVPISVEVNPSQVESWIMSRSSGSRLSSAIARSSVLLELTAGVPRVRSASASAAAACRWRTVFRTWLASTLRAIPNSQSPVLAREGEIAAPAPQHDENLAEQVGSLVSSRRSAGEIAQHCRPGLAVKVLDLRGLLVVLAHRNFQSQLMRRSLFKVAGTLSFAARTRSRS